MRIRGRGPRGRQESDERGGERKEGGAGGRVPALTPAAAATDGDARRARGGDARQAASAGEHARHGRLRVVGGEKGPHHRGGGERGGAGARRGAARSRRGHGGRRWRTPDHVQPGPPSAVGGEWRVDGGFGGFTATGGDAKGGRHRCRRSEHRRRRRRLRRRARRRAFGGRRQGQGNEHGRECRHPPRATISTGTHGLAAACAPMADATAVRVARPSPASTTAVDAPLAKAAARAESNAAIVPPSTAAASETPARSLVIVVARATHTAVTGGPDKFAAAAAAAAVTSATAVTTG